MPSLHIRQKLGVPLLWSLGESGSGRLRLQQPLKVLIHVIWFCAWYLQSVWLSLPSHEPYPNEKLTWATVVTQHPGSQFWPRPGWVRWEACWPALLLHTEVLAVAENPASVSVCIYREADLNHICPVFLAKREREIFVTRVIGFPAICIKISRCDCWCLTWDQLKKEGISRTNCVHVDTWLVCVCACVCASLLQCVCFKGKQNFSSKNFCFLLPGLSFCLHYPFLLGLSLSHSPGSIWIPLTLIHIYLHTFSGLPPTTALWLTLVTVIFHAGVTSLL